MSYPGIGNNIGDVLTWDGEKAVWIGPGSFIIDRFIGGAESVATSGNNRDANVGELQWNTFIDAGGTVTRVASESGHMGIVRMTSNSTGGRSSIYLGHASTSGNTVQLDEIDSTFWTVKYIQQRIRCGFGDNAAGSGLGNESFYVQAESAANAFWKIETRNGGNTTTTITTVPLVANEWITWRIQRISATEYRFYANDVLAFTTSPSDFLPNPAALLGPVMQAIQATTTAIGEIDTFTLQLK